MNRYMVSASVLVLCVAGLKTVLMTSFVLPSVDMGKVLGLFALFTALTAGVSYFAYNRVRALVEAQRKLKLAPGQGDTASKESVIQQCARSWGLSKAEGEVASLAAKGFSNSEIAEMRGSSVPTVNTQLGSIYQKSQLDSRYQLIAFVTDEVCEMATESDHRANAPSEPNDNVTPLVKKSSRDPYPPQSQGLPRRALAR